MLPRPPHLLWFPILSSPSPSCCSLSSLALRVEARSNEQAAEKQGPSSVPESMCSAPSGSVSCRLPVDVSCNVKLLVPLSRSRIVEPSKLPTPR